VRALGGDIDLDAEGKIVYRFTTESPRAPRAPGVARSASRSEASPGAVVFSSEN
jgi:hypothetical protein